MYTRPTPRACSSCGEPVIHEFGTFDADLYAKGRLFRHECTLPDIPPIYEKRRPVSDTTPAEKTPSVAPMRPTQGFGGGIQI